MMVCVSLLGYHPSNIYFGRDFRSITSHCVKKGEQNVICILIFKLINNDKRVLMKEQTYPKYDKQKFGAIIH